jgi:hypothetical protein
MRRAFFFAPAAFSPVRRCGKGYGILAANPARLR